MLKIPALVLTLLSLSLLAMVRPVAAIDPQYPIDTRNMNVRHLFENYQLMIDEILHSVTRDSIGTLPQDAARWLSYIASMRAYAAYWQSKSFLDWPVTHGREYTLENPLSVSCDWEKNQAACDLLVLVANARDELVVSSSAESLPMHLHPDDLIRQESYWNAAEEFITGFMLANNPLDEPVTSAKKRLDLPQGEVE